uniref:Uncharacterized protein n=1 Tax=Arcella intermedia TaxID=1963864 RepID=A0A6B2L432_9EUKA
MRKKSVPEKNKIQKSKAQSKEDEGELANDGNYEEGHTGDVKSEENDISESYTSIVDNANETKKRTRSSKMRRDKTEEKAGEASKLTKGKYTRKRQSTIQDEDSETKDEEPTSRRQKSRSTSTRKKRNGMSSSAAREGTTNAWSNTEEIDVEDTEEGLLHPGDSQKFWNTVKEYFDPLAPIDLEFCKIDKDSPGLSESSKFLVIPSLGVHYRELWYLQDQESQNQDRDDPKHTDSESNYPGEESTPFKRANNKLGDVTTRLLSALLQDQPVSASSLVSNCLNTAPQGPLEAVSLMVAIDSVFDNGIPHCSNELQAIEESIKKELQALGLFDPSCVVNTSENDELCQELKKLQAELRQQVIINKERRAKYYPLVANKIEEQNKEVPIAKLIEEQNELINELNPRKRKRAQSQHISSKDAPGKKSKKNNPKHDSQGNNTEDEKY